jgi:hypothetical protein
MLEVMLLLLLLLLLLDPLPRETHGQPQQDLVPQSILVLDEARHHHTLNSFETKSVDHMAGLRRAPAEPRFGKKSSHCLVAGIPGPRSPKKAAMENIRVGGPEQLPLFGSRQMTSFPVVHAERQD